MIKFFLARVLSWVAKISWSDFLRIVWAAESAAEQWPKTTAMTDEERSQANADRAAAVSSFITAAFGDKSSGWIVNVLRELAVAWVSRKGGA